MRLVLLFLAALILGVFALAACNSRESAKSINSVATPSTSPAPPNPSDNARRIKAAELHQLWEQGKVLVVDTRTEPAYKESHIKGAILIPAAEVATKTAELPHDKMIVTYCTWPSEHTSAGAVLTLNAKGFNNAAALLGGLDAWKKEGYPVEGTKQ
jgi:rhodanese-related sulfurtransferase